MDPSMLLAFIIRDEQDLDDWKKGVIDVQGKCIVHVSATEPAPRGQERPEAIDEVESFDEDGLE
jgi:cysteine protease ATG4